MTKYLRRSKASEYLKDIYGISRTPQTLAKLACMGCGPDYVYDGKIPLYSIKMLDAWAESILKPRAMEWVKA